jgi:hypothetical protein
MRSSSLSIKVFGIYVFLTGLTLIFVPNLLLSVFGFPPTQEIWIRVMGALATAVGYYYLACANTLAIEFFRATLIGRPIFAIVCFGLVGFAGAQWQLALFGLADLLGAAWTAFALRAERNPNSAVG